MRPHGHHDDETKEAEENGHLCNPRKSEYGNPVPVGVSFLIPQALVVICPLLVPKPVLMIIPVVPSKQFVGMKPTLFVSRGLHARSHRSRT